MKNITLLLLVIILAGCSSRQIEIHQSKDIVGLASPVQLNTDSTIIYLEDYFVDISKIESVKLNGKTVSLSEDNKKAIIKSEESFPRLMEMEVIVNGIPYQILCKKSEKINKPISFDPIGKKYKKVRIAGEMNGWNPAAGNLEFKDGIWQTSMYLSPGKYQYKLVLDKDWIIDPANSDSIDNNAGAYNSVLSVGKDMTEFLPKLFTKEIEGNEIELGFENEAKEFFVFWQNYRLPDEFFEIDDDEIKILIPENAKDFERSYLRVFAYNEHGISNDILVPLNKGKVITDVNELSRTDHQTLILYNAFVDRFYDGKKGNNKPVNDPEILPKANYFGGDIVGITKKIKDGYFTDLGINTVWVSPIIQNPEGAYGLWLEPRSKFSGYHGYWPISFTKIDYRFGNADEFKELVKEAHAKNLNVLLDFVANHIHENHPYYKTHPDCATNLYLPDGSLNTERWDEHRLTTWFDIFLPTLDLSKPEIVEMLTDSAVFWIKEYDLDGFRHDATKHVPELFWRTLTKKLKQQIIIPENKPLYQIGETYGCPELISSYVNSGELDGQFDFNVYDNAVAVFARKNESFKRLNNSILQSFKYYGNHNLMGYITGNQDRARFISYAGGELSFDEDTKLAGWTREIGVGDTKAYKQLSALTAFLMTIPGVPVIYFGDEIGDPGGNDPDNRRMMRFTDLNENEKLVKATTKKLIDIRKKNLSITFGEFIPLITGDKIYVYARTYFDEITVVVFCKDKSIKNIKIKLPERFAKTELKSNFGSNIEFNENVLNIEIGENLFEIIEN
ncbi:MAG: hypothetical protein K8R41_10060 [Bacteroidales bacterium]|nr:hypothetical protein [Bacteroidales bacterium]